MLVWLAAHAGVIGLLFFFTVFLSIMVWAFRPRNKVRIEAYRYIPMTEEAHDKR